MSTSEREEILKEVARQNLKQRPKLSQKTANAFNWAAFGFPFLYNAIYKRYVLALTFVILTVIPHVMDNFIPAALYLPVVYVLSAISLLLAIYSGMTGNKVVYDNRKYDDEEDFIRSQAFWLPAAVFIIIVHLLIIPIQKTGHFNTSQMMKLAQAKETLREAIQKGAGEGNLLGVNTVADKIPAYFAKYIKNGKFDGIDTIKMSNGVTYKIEGYMYECGSKAFNTYHEQKTSCATVTIDLNGEQGPNKTSSVDDIKATKGLLNRSVRLADVYTLYAYNDDMAPKEGSVEQYAFRKFEKE